MRLNIRTCSLDTRWEKSSFLPAWDMLLQISVCNGMREEETKGQPSPSFHPHGRIMTTRNVEDIIYYLQCHRRVSILKWINLLGLLWGVRSYVLLHSVSPANPTHKTQRNPV